MSEPSRSEIRVTIAAPVDDVWRAWRDPAEIRRWFGWDYDGLEAEIQMIFVDGPEEASEATHAVRWPTGDELRLEPLGDATVVHLTRPASPEDEDWDAVHEGWTSFVQQLRFALERHPGEERRSLRFAAQLPPGSAPPADSLRLAELAAEPPGERYELEAATGDLLSGELWYRSRHQLGLTVDSYGDGLLILASEPPEADPPNGRGTAVITTYGLGDEELDLVRKRWHAWWRVEYPGSGADTR